MRALWFICPAHGRAKLTAICLRQLRRTCDALTADGVDATAVIVADDENLDTARDLGFGTVERDNQSLSRKFNDGFQAACDPAFNPHPADYAVAIGSDDWIDHRILLPLPPRHTMVGFQRMSFVREDGREITTSLISYPGGAGIRIYPRALLEPFGYRPADEDRQRGCDTSIFVNLHHHHGHRMRVEHRHRHDRQIIDWKTGGAQLNSYRQLARHKRVDPADPFDALAGVFPQVALDEMRAHYGVREEVAA
jgi:hypothetical protein